MFSWDQDFMDGQTTTDLHFGSDKLHGTRCQKFLPLGLAAKVWIPP